MRIAAHIGRLAIALVALPLQTATPRTGPVLPRTLPVALPHRLALGDRFVPPAEARPLPDHGWTFRIERASEADLTVQLDAAGRIRRLSYYTPSPSFDSFRAVLVDRFGPPVVDSGRFEGYATVWQDTRTRLCIGAAWSVEEGVWIALSDDPATPAPADCAPAATTRPADPRDCPATEGFSFTGGSQLWPDAAWRARQDTVPRPAAYVVRQLAGTYDLLQVQTEGAGEKYLTLWRLTLAPPDSATRAAWARAPGAGRYLLAGAMRLRERRTFHEAASEGEQRPIRSPDDTGAVAVRLEYRPEVNGLLLEGGPLDMEDAGTLFPIATVTHDGRFLGRWTDGSYAVSVMPTSLARLSEHAQGYYCAWRIR